MSRQIHSCRKFVGFSQKDFRGKYKKKLFRENATSKNTNLIFNESQDEQKKIF